MTVRACQRVVFQLEPKAGKTAVVKSLSTEICVTRETEQTVTNELTTLIDGRCKNNAVIRSKDVNCVSYHLEGAVRVQQVVPESTQKTQAVPLHVPDEEKCGNPLERAAIPFLFGGSCPSR